MKNQFRFTAPIVHTIEIQRRPTTFAVSFPNRNMIVKMVIRGNHVLVRDEEIERTGKGRRQLKWEGTINKFFKLYPGAVGLQDAFRRYVKAWYCCVNESVL